MPVRKQLIDSLGAKILQDDRVEWWKSRGYKQLQFDYFQPPLSSKLKPSNELVLRINSSYKKEIPAELVWEHLNAFFSISILKGKSPLKDKTYVHQKKVLQKLQSIKIRN
jgi:hypothetical protein